MMDSSAPGSGVEGWENPFSSESGKVPPSHGDPGEDRKSIPDRKEKTVVRGEHLRGGTPSVTGCVLSSCGKSRHSGMGKS